MGRTIASGLLVAVLATACTGSDPREALVDVPEVDLASADPAVRDRIGRALAEVRALGQASRRVEAAELADTYGRLATLLHAYGRYEAAAAAYRNAETLDPAAFRWPYLLGVVLAAEDRHADAVAAFERALAVRGDDVPALLGLGEAELARGNAGEATRRFERALELDPDSARAVAGLGTIALERGDASTAVERLETALRLAPGATSLHGPLAQARRRAGDEEGARAAEPRAGAIPLPLDDPLLEEVLALRRGGSSRIERATTLAAEGRLEEAETELRQAIASDPGHPAAHATLGQVLASADRFDEARRAFEAALELDPTDAASHHNLGVVLARSGRDEAAVAQLEAALALEPERTDVRVALGDALRRLGRFEDALDTYRRAVATDPAHRGARLGEVLTLMRLHRWPESARAVDSARAAWPDDPDLRHVAVRLAAAAPDDAVRDGERAVELARGLMRRDIPIDQLEAAAMAAAAGGRWADAVRLQEQVIRAAERVGPEGPGDLAEMRRNLERYRDRKPAARPWPDESPVLSPPPLAS